jgi:flagellar basal-body rod modification protein FlgD
MTTSSVTGNCSTEATAAGLASAAGAALSGDFNFFLKMLTTQLQNQDPLNPADNSEITSQMAQINTVTGIGQLNTTMTSMNSSITQLQMMQGTSLVGHQVLLAGNQLTSNSNGSMSGGYSLDSAAGSVTITISDAAGNKLDTVTQSGVAAGQQYFNWTPPAGTSTSGLTFSVSATGGGKTINATPLMTDQVEAVSNSSGSLNLELKNNGTTAYSKIVAVS